MFWVSYLFKIIMNFADIVFKSVSFSILTGVINLMELVPYFSKILNQFLLFFFFRTSLLSMRLL